MPFRYCEHIKTDGIQCHSPAMGDGRWCYYHGLYRRRIRSWVDKDNDAKNLYRKALGEPVVHGTEQERQQFVLGPLEDAASVQIALSTVINALATNRMDRRRAAALLYGLQLAANNLRGIANAPEIGDSLSTPPATPSTRGTCAQDLAEKEHNDYLGTELPTHQELAASI